MNFIIFDLEATCWLGRPPNGINEVIEIGAVKMDQYGGVVGEFNRFVKPVVNPVLSSFCTELTTITQEQVAVASKFPRVFRDFQDWIDLGTDYLLCSWGDADIRILHHNCDLYKLETEWLEHYINLKKQYHDIKNMRKLTGLKRTLTREGFDFNGTHHRAISDAQNLCKIFAKYIDEWVY